MKRQYDKAPVFENGIKLRSGQFMKAVICHQGQLSVEQQPDPTPSDNQVVLEVLRCGICGSDLHARHHCNSLADSATKAGLDGLMRFDQKVVLGHEFCGEVTELGPKANSKIKPGTRVCALPFLQHNNQLELLGFSERVNGAYAEYTLVEDVMMVPIPNGLDTDIAALTEPMAIGWHAVNRADISRKDVAVIIGCGPVGLAVISALKAKGIEQVIASDFSPKRRELAQQCGADIVVDPAEQSAFDNWQAMGFSMRTDDLLGQAIDARRNMDKAPIAWWHQWRLAEKLGVTKIKRPVIFECVGVPGLIQNLIDQAPIQSRLVVVGVCMENDNFVPSTAINKEIDIRFCVGYTPLEYRDTLHLLAEGKLTAAPLITGKVGLDGVENAFDALADPEQHAKILIDPRSSLSCPA
ncbi:zinc-binding dehydrogenase [Maricurvus nonylphenolicus]|uniref:zinc-binding dehydrogenase n=1 Tax=Maricurvus nonylphenolicus TaxID=1008307 RepID=UPI0036F201E0